MTRDKNSRRSHDSDNSGLSLKALRERQRELELEASEPRRKAHQYLLQLTDDQVYDHVQQRWVPQRPDFEEGMLKAVIGFDKRASPIEAKLRKLRQLIARKTSDEDVIGSAVPLLLTSVVEPISAVPDGSLVELVEPAWLAVLEALIKKPYLRFHFSPRKMEELIAASYKASGYDVILTPGSGDRGRDVIATKEGFGRIRIIDQVKKFKPGHLVTANDVRALLGVMSGERNVSKGCVTTTSDFAPRIDSDPFISEFIPYRLELINGDALHQHLKQLWESPNKR